jgi:hypothetical protein
MNLTTTSKFSSKSKIRSKEDRGFLSDMLKKMALDEDAELKSNENILPTIPNNELDITRDKSMISEKSIKAIKKQKSSK